MHSAWHLLSSFLVQVALKCWNVTGEQNGVEREMPHHCDVDPLGVCTQGLHVAPQKVGESWRDLGVNFQSLPVPPALRKVCEGSTWPLLSPWQSHVAGAWLGLRLPGRAAKSSDIFLRTGCTSEPQKLPQISSDNNKTGKELLAHR